MDVIDPQKLPRHVAVIMDGNGRWAKQHGLQRVRGHQKGAEAVRRIVRISRKMGIQWLTLYAFSEENWQRPKREIQALMRLLGRFLRGELDEMLANGIRLRAIGRIHKLPEHTRRVLEDTINKTAVNDQMTLTLALSYGGRQEITDAVHRLARQVAAGLLDPDQISQEQIAAHLYAQDMPDPDLLIRTSGELRVSNFLLWQIAYTELYITPTLWPDFGEEEFRGAIAEFQRRERRFGASSPS